MESHVRSLAKAATYRVTGTIVTVVIAWLVTGKPVLSIGIGLFDSAVKVGVFYLHERIWNGSSFGRAKPPEYQI